MPEDIMRDLQIIGVDALYLLALINPISKVSVLAALPSELRGARFCVLAAKSSVAAAGILFGAMIVGDFVLRSVFRVDLYSLKLAGGVVVFWMGLNALRHGVFFDNEPHAQFADIALVPLACPMIAGPATIAACIGLPANHGVFVSTAAIILALGTNHILMMFSQSIGLALRHYNVLGAIIRITGLIVMTIGMQMALDGLGAWIAIKHL
jgi:multiple antibiotic resistance protein